MNRKKKSPRVTIILLNWNGKRFLEQNLDSVLEQDHRNYEVLVVDNASDDGSQEFVKEKQRKRKKLKLLENKKNLGFVRGNNKGVGKVLKEGKSKYIVLLNNDVKVEESWLSNLISGFGDESIGICSSKIMLYYPYQQIVIVPSSGCVINKIKINGLSYHALEFKKGFDDRGELLKFPKKLKGGEIYNFAIPYEQVEDGRGKLEIKFEGKKLKIFTGEVKRVIGRSGTVDVELKGQYIFQNAGTIFLEERMVFKDRFIFEFNRDLQSELVDAGCGAAMAIRCDLLKKLGSFKKKYFMYFEDTELSYRFKKAGFNTKFISNATCYHHFWGSSGGKVTRNQTFYGTRNRLWFIREYFGMLRFIYFYMRVFIRTCIWAVKMPFSRDARMFFASYASVLKEVLGRYN